MSPSSSPSCCVGLRQTLLSGWRQGFPLHPSPFRQMAAQSGATPHELLVTCGQLQRSGALQGIRPRWGQALQRERWRLAFQPGLQLDALARAVAALPGCLRVERAQPDGDLPTLWAEIEALDEAALQRQLARLPLPPAARLRLAHPSQPGGGPCDDPQLSACVERGLPLCANPFAKCAAQLGRTERQLLASLHAWQRAGHLDSLVLAPPPLGPQTGMLAVWRQLPRPPSAALLGGLRAQPGVERVHTATPSAAWPWALSLVLLAPPPLAPQRLRECLAGAGLATPPDAATRLLIEQPRDPALLFAA